MKRENEWSYKGTPSREEMKVCVRRSFPFPRTRIQPSPFDWKQASTAHNETSI